MVEDDVRVADTNASSSAPVFDVEIYRGFSSLSDVEKKRCSVDTWTIGGSVQSFRKAPVSIFFTSRTFTVMRTSVRGAAMHVFLEMVLWNAERCVRVWNFDGLSCSRGESPLPFTTPCAGCSCNVPILCSGTLQLWGSDGSFQHSAGFRRLLAWTEFRGMPLSSSVGFWICQVEQLGYVFLTAKQEERFLCSCTERLE